MKKAMRLADANSRWAWQLTRRDPREIRFQLEALGYRTRIRPLARALGCSKPTILKFVRLGLLSRCRRRKASLQAPFEIMVSSAHWLVELCRRIITHSPLPSREFSRVRRRIELRGTQGDYRALPRRLSIHDAAQFLRCSKTTVIRMIAEGILSAKHPSPRRWEIPKHEMRWWSREKM